MSIVEVCIDAEFEAILRARIQMAHSSDSEVTDVRNPIASVLIEDLQELGQVRPSVSMNTIENTKVFNILSYSIPETVDAKGVAEIVVGVGADSAESEFQIVESENILKCVERAIEAVEYSGLIDDPEFSPEVRDMLMSFQKGKKEHLIGSLRVIVLVCGFSDEDSGNFETKSDFSTKLDVWDIQRFAQFIDSGQSYESVEIDLKDFSSSPIPCISSSDISDEHRCHFAVFPGDLLHALYKDFGDRLLELNVRKYLQSSRKINRGIQETIRNNPERFLAYNNGISATVESIEVTTGESGESSIQRLKGLQIVNGGQTTASIHEAKEMHGVDISRVEVQVKITEIRTDHDQDIVEKISQFSNTQNKVANSDLSSNHSYHKKMELLAKEIGIPSRGGYWFYERKKGQYANERRLSKIENGNTKSFDARSPKEFLFDKLDVARTFNAWSLKPFLASKGTQASYKYFFDSIEKKKADWLPDEDYFKDAVARVVIYRALDEICKLLEIESYKAQLVDYAVALIAYRTAGRLDLENIWSASGISDALRATATSWLPLIHEEIVLSANGKNVTEWCKKTDCWARIQVMNLAFDPDLEVELREGLELPTVGSYKASKKGKAKELTSEQRENQARVQKHNSDEWNAVIKWGRELGVLADWQLGIAGTILGYAAAGWIQVPSPNQTKHLVEVLNLWERHLQENEGREE